MPEPGIPFLCGNMRVLHAARFPEGRRGYNDPALTDIDTNMFLRVQKRPGALGKRVKTAADRGILIHGIRIPVKGRLIPVMVQAAHQPSLNQTAAVKTAGVLSRVRPDEGQAFGCVEVRVLLCFFEKQFRGDCFTLQG